MGRTLTGFPYFSQINVAPVPAWAGLRYLAGSRHGLSCPCARVGRTPGAYWAVYRVGLPLCPRGPDGGVGWQCSRILVAPVPAWAGRPLACIGTRRGLLPLCPRGPDYQPMPFDDGAFCCPCARVGRT